MVEKGNYKMLSEEERKKLIEKLNLSYYIPELWEKRESFLNLTEDQYRESIFDVCSTILIKILSGDLDDIPRLMSYLPDVGFEDFIKPIIPTIPLREVFRSLNRLDFLGVSLEPYYGTACGRPSYLNGMHDFSYYGNFILNHKTPTNAIIKAMYGDIYEQVYNLLAAELLYQRNECYEAMVKITSTIPVLEQKKNTHALFVALYLQLSILAINGETKSASLQVQNMRERLAKVSDSNLNYNIDAIEARVALYDGNVEFINKWMEELAPDESHDINLLDTYRYFVKLRCYLLYDKHLALISLAEHLKHFYIIGHRTVDALEVDCLLAMSWYKSGKKENAFDIMDSVLETSERLHIYRYIADEGVLMFKLLQDYQKERGTTPYLDKLIDITRKVAVLYPNYLNLHESTDTSFTDMEIDILKLLEQGKTYDDVADIFSISVNTVRYHIKKIYPKLGVSSASQAIFKAKKMGLI